MTVPKYFELINPVFQSLHSLGSSATISEIEEEVIKLLKLSNKDINEIFRKNVTKLSYRLAWARSYLKHYGLIDNSSRGVWILADEGKKIKSVNGEEIKKAVREEYKKKRREEKGEAVNEIEEITWKEKLLEIIQNIKPEAFERLCQRLLRESGFESVEVTQRSGDGGIDGKGVLKLGKVLSFKVLFQSKRYSGSVGPSIVRDFRGAMIGKADRGILITTGNFTREARLEAQRDGAPPIDLIDGNALVEMLKDFSMGVAIDKKIIEDVKINKDWFESI